MNINTLMIYRDEPCQVVFYSFKIGILLGESKCGGFEKEYFIRFQEKTIFINQI